jgi:hypothetical protein
MNNSEILKSKSQFSCSYCSRIFKDPIQLPCDDSIYHEHLSERNVVKENRIKCKKCNEEFVVKGKQFKSNDDLRKLLERSESYLSEEESSLKKITRRFHAKVLSILRRVHSKQINSRIERV